MDELEPSAQTAVDSFCPCAGVTGPSQHLLSHSGDEGQLGMKASQTFAALLHDHRLQRHNIALLHCKLLGTNFHYALM